MKAIPVICAVALLLVAFGSMPANTSQAHQEDERAVRAAADQFYAALNAMFTGDLEPMKQIWSHGEDVTYMGPGGGFRVGWDAVLADWETQVAMNLGGEVHPENMRITVGRDLAVVSNNEIGENVGPDGEPQEVSIRATNVFRREGGAWKMIGHHTDLLPFIEE